MAAIGKAENTHKRVMHKLPKLSRYTRKPNLRIDETGPQSSQNNQTKPFNHIHHTSNNSNKCIFNILRILDSIIDSLNLQTPNKQKIQ